MTPTLRLWHMAAPGGQARERYACGLRDAVAEPEPRLTRILSVLLTGAGVRATA
ncbi:hypothetical protein [Actinacidiphila rubida]|uniref:Uncharacterized protein n=1 Tax=Actinacidiphila rubida TaxID=310780 RepID=A0A1H8Q688_9ACTN|nr:hypothetical protein [Actinacidiphila rubida]SEO49548.1 hypothetical protein SAMN05216267_102860 [Actinacidiphila rubida]